MRAIQRELDVPSPYQGTSEQPGEGLLTAAANSPLGGGQTNCTKRCSVSACFNVCSVTDDLSFDGTFIRILFTVSARFIDD